MSDDEHPGHRDGTERLCHALYGRPARPRDYLGGSDARMLHDAADLIARLRGHAPSPSRAEDVDPGCSPEDRGSPAGEIPEPWQDRLVFDPNISEDSPVVRGTWVTAKHIVSLIVDGWTWSDILRTHPELVQDDIRSCLSYAQESER